MNRTLLTILAKCVEDNQTNWSSQPPFILIAYRSSVHQSTGFALHQILFGHEICLTYELMQWAPQDYEPESLSSWVWQKQKACRRACSRKILLTNAVATVCTTDLCFIPPLKKENTFFSTTLCHSRKKFSPFAPVAVVKESSRLRHPELFNF